MKEISKNKLNHTLNFISPKLVGRFTEQKSPADFKMSTWHVLNYSKEEEAKVQCGDVDKRVSL